MDNGNNKEFARELLKLDFEKTFDVHTEYKKLEQETYSFSLKILALPLLIIATLISSNLIQSNQKLEDVLNINFIWYSLILAGFINIPLVKSFVTIDKILLECKIHLNQIRDAAERMNPDLFRKNIDWKEKNSYLGKKARITGSYLKIIVLNILNSVYIASGIYKITEITAAAVIIFLALFIFQFPLTKNLKNKKIEANKQI